MKRLALLLAAAWSLEAAASPCTGVDRSLDPDRRARLALAIAAQLKAPSVDVLKSFRHRGWQIVLVDTPLSDEAYLFYAGDPLKSTSLTAWGGAARVDEGPEIERWVRQNAKGIPRRLAACFAFHVTRDRGH